MPHKKIEVSLPANLDFEENYESTASHFKTLRHAISCGITVASLRFNNLRCISAAAALVLASEVDRWNQRVGGKLKARIEEWDPNIERLLEEMGYFELLKLEHLKSPPTQKNTTFIKFKRGDLFKKDDYGKIAQKLREEIENLVGLKINRHLLYEGLSEAITNVSQHAYPASPSFSFRQWWLSASYNKKSKNLSVLFYDQGVGIPETLQEKGYKEFMKSIFSTWKDSQKIEAAMEIGRSASEMPERGKGLQNFVEFAQHYREGRLAIYSLHGMYEMVFSRWKGALIERTVRKDFSNSIGGTLIEWRVKLY